MKNQFLCHLNNSYNQINKVKEKYNEQLKAKDEEISSLKDKLQKSEEKVNELRPTQNISESNGILSDYEIQCLVVMLCHENSPRAGAAHNANSVGCMVNRVRDGGWGANSIYDAIMGGCAPYWRGSHGSWCMDNFCTNDMDTGYAYEAVDYYLNNHLKVSYPR